MKNTSVTAFNAGTTGGATSKNLTSNGADVENTMVVEIDTVNDTANTNAVKLTMNGSKVYEATSINIHKSEAAKGAVDTIQFSNMRRMGTGAYLTIKSINVEGNHLQMSELDDETIEMINTFPTSIADDPYNVTGNVTVPRDIPGLVWKSSDETVMTPYGKITRTSDSDNKEVELYAKFNGKTKDGKTIELKKSYYLTVEGLKDQLKLNQTVNPTPGADETTEKWYTMPERNGTEDGYPILGDPMNISDEAFFGKWDSVNSKWVLQPYFKYSAYPLLKDVEAYAKTGDYAGAKQALLNYYKVDASKKVVHTTSIGTTNQKYNNIIYELMSRNAFATNYVSSFVIDTFKLTKNWSDIDIIATSRLKEALGSYDIFSVMIASIDKYKNQGMVYSRDSEKPPVLTVILRDNTVIECPAVKDSYIRGGDYADTNYGNENILLAEEAGTLNDYEDRTKRIYIGFDISGLNKNMDIKRAYVKFTGMHNGSDDEKLMLCYWFCDGSWAEDKICLNTFSEHMYFSCNDMVGWDYAPKGELGKSVGYYRNVEPSRLSDMYSYYSNMDTTDANYVSDYEKYAYTYLRHNMSLINSLGVSRKYMSALDMSTHIIGISEDVLRLIDSKYMTPEIFTAILKHLWEMSDYNAYMDFGDKTSNWATFATGAVYAMCSRFPELAR
ncbi:MAG: hypothetical protein UH854_03350, partial [Clostridia bacterium]|nr:hypothetical protein [Clostridia bacterium]